MLRALVDGETVRRQPMRKGERARCRCGAELIAVVPIDHAAHWRHRGRDCDPWSEPEGPWHLNWKARFPADCCEVELVDPTSGEWHRADVRCLHPSGGGAVLELQHSSISAEEQVSREEFYGREHTMYWLLHMHDESNFRGTYFGMSLSFNDPVDFKSRQFFRMNIYGDKRFIDRWKRSSAHVLLEVGGHVFYLATMAACRELVAAQGKGQFAVMRLSQAQVIATVRGLPPPPQ